MCQMSKEEFKEVRSVVRLWVHECERVLCDRLISDFDIVKFKDMRTNTARKFFDNVPQVLFCLPVACLSIELKPMDNSNPQEKHRIIIQNPTFIHYCYVKNVSFTCMHYICA